MWGTQGNPVGVVKCTLFPYSELSNEEDGVQSDQTLNYRIPFNSRISEK